MLKYGLISCHHRVLSSIVLCKQWHLRKTMWLLRYSSSWGPWHLKPYHEHCTKLQLLQNMICGWQSTDAFIWTVKKKERRFAIFKSNGEYVEKFNRDENNTYKLGLNEFADLSHRDFVQQYNGYINPTEQTSSADVSFSYESLGCPDVPLSIDRRMYGAVTTVKYQVE